MAGERASFDVRKRGQEPEREGRRAMFTEAHCVRGPGPHGTLPRLTIGTPEFRFHPSLLPTSHLSIIRFLSYGSDEEKNRRRR